MAAFGIAAALGLGVIGLLSDSFLRENLVAIGWLTAATGWVVVHLKTHVLLGRLIAATGVSSVLTVMLITGRFRLYLRPRRIGLLQRQDRFKRSGQFLDAPRLG